MENKLQTFWLTKGDHIEEWFRMKFHTYIVTGLTLFNVLLLGTSGITAWLAYSFEFPFFNILPLDSMSWWAFLFLMNVPLLTWFYSTITYPIKKGYKVIVDWGRTEKGRKRGAILNGISFIFTLWAAWARYTHEHYSSPLLKIRVDEKQYGYLLATSLEPFLTFVYFFPVLLTLIVSIIAVRHYMLHQDVLQKQFFKWEFPLLTKYAHNLNYKQCDVIVGWDKENKKPLILKEDSRYLHELVVGATGSGKTSTTLLLRIVQDLVRIAKGEKVGVVLLEPKGDAVEDVLSLAEKLGVPEEKIYVIDPTKDKTTKFNPFYGPLEAAAESFRGTLDSLSGDQDAFFKGQQNETAALYTMLAKLYYGSLTNITHIQQMYSDPRYLANLTERVREQLDKRLEDTDLTPADKKSLAMYERVVRYFEDEVLEYKTFRERDKISVVRYPEDHRYAGQQMVENKKDKYVSGAKQYLNDIATNQLLSDLMVPKDNDKVLDLDHFLAEGGVLLVNTALGDLEELSLMLGQFFIRQFQGAVFRRPKDNRCPTFFTIDEFPLYINEAFERFLTLGRSYKVGTTIAIQSLGQLESVVKGYKETILGNASNKTVFGRGPYVDNKLFSDTFGEEEIVEESMNESTSPIQVENPSWGLRHNTQKKLVPRFTPTDIKELPFKHMIVELVDENNSISVPRVATGAFVSEAKFLKKYFKLAELNMKSENEENDESVNVDAYSKFTPVNEKAPSITSMLSDEENPHAAEFDKNPNEPELLPSEAKKPSAEENYELLRNEVDDGAIEDLSLVLGESQPFTEPFVDTLPPVLEEVQPLVESLPPDSVQGETVLNWESVLLPKEPTDSKAVKKKQKDNNSEQMDIFSLSPGEIEPYQPVLNDDELPPLMPLEESGIPDEEITVLKDRDSASPESPSIYNMLVGSTEEKQNEWIDEGHIDSILLEEPPPDMEHSIPDAEALQQIDILVQEVQNTQISTSQNNIDRLVQEVQNTQIAVSQENQGTKKEKPSGVTEIEETVIDEL
ncbi:type IV secretory system conjugative DNA transfer family protein [Peribacillus asahii]|uniref:type IV secretory system conjugative DNA transfer family protein n=1 Tax=Peribacillus asahii TaxID=228899 RepID=UPI00207A3AB7|nr:type IV secretory system conjugative DNA transfer family protein [Peribacillus asahii]USK62312.1 type IV secretory system conjugative DNA transfer family protein [Peribacillus asahii]